MLSDSCWLWGGSYFQNGYGQAWSKTLRRGTQAHRLVYESLRGTIPEGKQLDHLCRVRGCVNPDHLRVVTSQENQLAPGSESFALANALKTKCPVGHLYDSRNTYVTPSGKRQCRICKVAEKQARMRRRNSLVQTEL